jgi:hypothetical protein
MRAHDGAIEHQVTIVLSQRSEDPLPHPAVRPPAEALMYRLPMAIALRQVTPALRNFEDFLDDTRAKLADPLGGTLSRILEGTVARFPAGT